MGEEHSEALSDNIYFLENQEVIVNDFEAEDFILDIGGGGEGIIGQLKGQQVVAIDPKKRELEEAPEGPLKVVMDAGELLFLDGSFNVATSFFTLMYINGLQHKKVLEEVFRVLRDGGRFIVWDMELPERLDESKEIVAAYLKVRLPNNEVNTGYGTKWPDQVQGLSYYTEIAVSVGFSLMKRDINGRVFRLEFRKQVSHLEG